MFKNQTKCYRNIKNERYINGGDLYYTDKENKKIITDIKKRFGKQNCKIMGRGDSDRAIFIKEKVFNEYYENREYYWNYNKK